MNKKQFNRLLSGIEKIRNDIEDISNAEARLIIKAHYISNIITVEIKNHVSLSQLMEITEYFKTLGYYLHEIEAEDYLILLNFYDFEEAKNERDGEGNKKNQGQPEQAE